MKIIRRSAHDYEDWRGDEYVVSSGMTPEFARRIVNLLNDDAEHGGDDFFVVVPDDYVLKPDWRL